MQPPSPQILTCPTCGGALEQTFGGKLGCMICLLRAGIGCNEEVPQDSAHEGVDGDTHFGIYEIDRREDGSLFELGRGAMGVTYRATDTTLKRKVALKIIKVDVIKRSVEARERFMREARAAAALRHENIATVYQFGIREETGQYFYAMELIEGETLEERVRRAGPLDTRTTIQIGQQITSALAAAEKHGLVHRDLKPANLMLVSNDGETAGADQPVADTATQKRARKTTTLLALAASLRPGLHRKHEKLQVKIIDFGLAKALNTQTDPQSLTHERFVGTPAFASPEQIEHSTLDVRSDIYSLGETLWFALTGKTPFAGRSVDEIHEAQQSNALPIQQLKAAHVPSRLKSLLRSMLALQPASRPNPKELATRLQRCSPEASQLRRKRFALAAAALLILGISPAFMLLSLRTQNSISNLGASGKSIAVLPFENLSRDPENTYFADGVQDEILTRLATLADLKVINRTSVMQYKSGVARDLHEIGHQLGVALVVEGSVQRAGNRVRVNAQLIDVFSNRALWGQTYERDLADVFAIQSEIATSIARQLQASLSPREKAAIEQAPTNDISAFELYARADRLTARDAKANLLEAADLLNQAVARDPSFFKAYCLLAWIHDLLYFLGHDHTPARLASAEAAIEAAFRLRPDAGEAHLARAQNLYQGYLDYDAALAELKLAAVTLPNNARVFDLKGLIERRQGNPEEALRSFERAIDLDPRNIYTLKQMAYSYRLLRLFSKQKSVLERALTIDPDNIDIKLELATLEFYWKADTRPLHQTVDSIRTINPAATQDISDYWLFCALAERDAAAAQDAVIAAGENAPLSDETVNFSRPFMEGVIARMTNDDAGARAAFTEARAEQQKILQAPESYGPALCVLGLIDAGLGRKEEALKEGRRAVELLPVNKDAIYGVGMLEYFAMIAAWVGDKDLACEQLAIAIRPPSPLNYGHLKLLPFWDPLRGDPRFEKIVTSLAPK